MRAYGLKLCWVDFTETGLMDGSLMQYYLWAVIRLADFIGCCV